MQIIVDAEIPTDELAAVEEAVRSASIDEPVNAAYIRRGLGDYPWIMRVEGLPWNMFLLLFIGWVGEDAYDGGKNLVRKVWHARKGRSGNVTFSDDATGTDVVIPGDLDDEAYRALREVDLNESGECGQINWDPQSREWKPPW